MSSLSSGERTVIQTLLELNFSIRGIARFLNRSPATISVEIRQTIIGDEQPITCRPADLIEPELEGYRQDLASKGYNGITDEDVLTYAMFPEVAINFFDANRR